MRPKQSSRPAPVLTNGLSQGHYFGIKSYKQRKFGVGAAAWDAFRFWVQDEFNLTCGIEDYRDWQGKAVIEAMKLLPDADPEGQHKLF